MRILALGDVVGKRAIEYLEKTLWEMRKRERIDFVIANGENASEIHGLSAQDAKRLLDCGADVITLGNHTYGQKDLAPLLEREYRIIRPANYPPSAPGIGYTVYDACGWKLLCMNVNGRAFMDAFGDPFDAVERILARENGKYDYSILDIHAECTSEKYAIARAFDGSIDVMFGTHTHVPTADEQILPKGSAYQTDLGMCGPTNGVIGTDSDCVITKFRTLMPTRFKVADGPIRANGTVFELDGSVKSVRRIVF